MWSIQCSHWRLNMAAKCQQRKNYMIFVSLWFNIHVIKPKVRTCSRSKLKPLFTFVLQAATPSIEANLDYLYRCGCKNKLIMTEMKKNRYVCIPNIRFQLQANLQHDFKHYSFTLPHTKKVCLDGKILPTTHHIYFPLLTRLSCLPSPPHSTSAKSCLFQSYSKTYRNVCYVHSYRWYNIDWTQYRLLFNWDAKSKQRPMTIGKKHSYRKFYEWKITQNKGQSFTMSIVGLTVIANRAKIYCFVNKRPFIFSLLISRLKAFTRYHQQVQWLSNVYKIQIQRRVAHSVLHLPGFKLIRVQTQRKLSLCQFIIIILCCLLPWLKLPRAGMRRWCCN